MKNHQYERTLPVKESNFETSDLAIRAKITSILVCGQLVDTKFVKVSTNFFQTMNHFELYKTWKILIVEKSRLPLSGAVNSLLGHSSNPDRNFGKKLDFSVMKPSINLSVKRLLGVCHLYKAAFLFHLFTSSLKESFFVMKK